MGFFVSASGTLASRLIGVVLLVMLSGCRASYVQHTAKMRTLADEGRFDEALAELDTAARNEELELDPLLVAADRGGLLHRAGDWEGSSRVFVEASRLADEHEVVRLSEEFTGNIPWRMGALERQTLHTLNALNYLQLGRADEAAVEARLTSALNLQRHLMQRYDVQLEHHLLAIPIDEELRPYLVQSVIGLYVSGLAHEVAGNEESAFIDYLAAWRITRSAPRGAPSSMTHLEPCCSRRRGGWGVRSWRSWSDTSRRPWRRGLMEQGSWSSSWRRGSCHSGASSSARRASGSGARARARGSEGRCESRWMERAGRRRPSPRWRTSCCGEAMSERCSMRRGSPTSAPLLPGASVERMGIGKTIRRQARDADEGGPHPILALRLVTDLAPHLLRRLPERVQRDVVVVIADLLPQVLRFTLHPAQGPTAR
ncbi:hypothetical protein SAMN05443572_102997 [Myxococcus fulvus]|uniref:Uncharacterized protein n=1 Tax=Myxococcus fulvus TaxID=33 RepID=A0A511SX40_MYXFU|nr:hypothetical protein [Myxococcus fulvus]GEN05883.1 hypothetical protein MFU01_09200 [Myxococcus fulvus]SET64574.1 hypothetical protein SAMN05443572_102997 [Myxococcus fulvus]